MNSPRIPRDGPSLNQRCRNVRVKSSAIWSLLILTVLLSFSHIGKSFQTIDAVMYNSPDDIGGPITRGKEKTSLKNSMDKDANTGDGDGNDSNDRRREIEEIQDLDNEEVNDEKVEVKESTSDQKQQDSKRDEKYLGTNETKDKVLTASDEMGATGSPETLAPTKKLIHVFRNTTDDIAPPPATSQGSIHDNDNYHTTNERIAIVLRSMDPVKETLLERLILIAELMEKDEFRNYDFHIMIDQTKVKLTSNASLSSYFRMNNASHLKPPTVFSVTENSILEEFPALAKGYVPGPLVDGGKGRCCGQPLLWQLLMPTFVTFVHYHQQYDFTWVLEDDLWTVGTPIVEVLRTWDEKLKGENASLAGTRVGSNGIPYSRMTKERHTYGFRDILMEMKATGWQHRNRTLLSMDNQKRSRVWNKWGGNVLPFWSCMSDTVYRHSRDFGDYVYGMVKSNVYQFAECYQMPLAWYGGFKIADLKTIFPPIDINKMDGKREESGMRLKWEDLAYNRKLEYDAAKARFADYAQNSSVSAVIYHEDTVPQNGQQFRTKREHTRLCSLSFDFLRDITNTSECEATLAPALKNATAVLFIGNFPIFKVFDSFMKIAAFPFEIIKDDDWSQTKIKTYYKYPPANPNVWKESQAGVKERGSEIFGSKMGKGVCKRCRQAKLKSKSKSLTVESLLVETSRDLYLTSKFSNTSQETVTRWISENYDDGQNTVCVMHMDGLEMNAPIWRTKAEFLENTKAFHEMLKPHCGTIIRFGFLPFFSRRHLKEVVAWDEALRDLVLDDSTINGYFVDTSNAKKSGSKNRYAKPIWRMFVKLLDIPNSKTWII